MKLPWSSGPLNRGLHSPVMGSQEPWKSYVMTLIISRALELENKKGRGSGVKFNKL